MSPVVVDNADTWLDFTDLVFIDPPGTGYSRILAKGDETRRHFYSVNGDIDALAVTIRKWLTANKRLDSPKFIVGESYGGFRAPKLARRLQDKEGIGIEGLVLISPVLDFGWFEGANNPLTFVTRLPSQAAAAKAASPGQTGARRLPRSKPMRRVPTSTDLLRGERDPAGAVPHCRKSRELHGPRSGARPQARRPHRHGDIRARKGSGGRKDLQHL